MSKKIAIPIILVLIIGIALVVPRFLNNSDSLPTESLTSISIKPTPADDESAVPTDNFTVPSEIIFTTEPEPSELKTSEELAATEGSGQLDSGQNSNSVQSGTEQNSGSGQPGTEQYTEKPFVPEEAAIELVRESVPELEVYSNYINNKPGSKSQVDMWVEKSSDSFNSYDTPDGYYRVFFGENQSDIRLQWCSFLVSTDFEDVMVINPSHDQEDSGSETANDVLSIDEWRSSDFYTDPDDLYVEPAGRL